MELMVSNDYGPFSNLSEVSTSLAEPNAHVSSPARAYARAIEKGSNYKARRVERHRALTSVILPFMSAK